MKPHKILFSKLLVLMLGILWLSCNTSNNAMKSDTSSNENGFNSLQAVLFAYHFSEDSSSVYCSINSEDLLYARKLGDTDFSAYISFKYNLYKIENNISTFVDSGTFYFKDVISKNRKKAVFKADLPLLIGRYNLQIELSDLQRKSEYAQTLSLDKTNRSNQQNFLVIDQSTGLACASNQIMQGDSILIESARNRSLNILNVYSFTSESKLPPAPFSIANPEIPQLSDAAKSTITIENGLVRYKVENHLQLVSVQENVDSGLAFVAFRNEYPTIKKKDELHPPLRYLTTKQEFENISKSKNPKEKVDLFWIECGGSKDRARSLIAEYYQRVQIANKFFHSYTEGWRTDRGMIYLIFGEPTRINSSNTQQTWIYGDDSNGTALKFVFTKTANIWSDNVYLLRRDPMFRTHWERMVTAWRNGRVYTNS